MIVVDTHVLVWWANQSNDKLSKTAKNHLQKAEKLDGGIIASAISAWEIAILVSKGRLILSMDVEDWLDNVAALPGLCFLPVDRYTLVQSTRLPEPFHQDPADRIIVATARGLNLPLVTADQLISAYSHVRTVW
jgi:PIN domain nuclease of toxin-antitoxin system